MLEWLNQQRELHNANQARGQGLKIYTQMNKTGTCYLTYYHYIGSKRIPKGLGIGIPVVASVADQKKIWNIALSKINSLARNPEQLAANSIQKATAPIKPTLKNQLNEWLEIKKITSKSIWNPKSAARNLEEYFGIDHDITTIDADDILLYEAWLKTEKKYNPHSTFTVMSNSRTFFCWCHRKGYLQKQVEIHCTRGKTNPNEIALDDSELTSLKNAPCPNRDVKNLFLLGCNVGTRKCDLKRLTFRDFGEVKKGKYVVHDIVNYEQAKLQRKENSKAKIYMIADSKAYIMDQWNNSAKDLDSKVFEFSHKEQNTAWSAWIKAAKITRKIRLSGLRHTAATRLRSAKCDARTIQRIIGWSSLAQLDAVYMGDDDNQLLANAGRLGK